MREGRRDMGREPRMGRRSRGRMAVRREAFSDGTWIVAAVLRDAPHQTKQAESGGRWTTIGRSLRCAYRYGSEFVFSESSVIQVLAVAAGRLSAAAYGYRRCMQSILH